MIYLLLSSTSDIQIDHSTMFHYNTPDGYTGFDQTHCNALIYPVILSSCNPLVKLLAILLI